MNILIRLISFLIPPTFVEVVDLVFSFRLSLLAVAKPRKMISFFNITRNTRWLISRIHNLIFTSEVFQTFDSFQSHPIVEGLLLLVCIFYGLYLFSVLLKSLDVYKACCLTVLTSCVFLTFLVSIATAYDWPMKLAFNGPTTYMLCTGCFVLFPLTLVFLAYPGCISVKFMEGFNEDAKLLIHTLICAIVFFLNIFLLAVYVSNHNPDSMEVTFVNIVEKFASFWSSYGHSAVAITNWIHCEYYTICCILLL